MGGRGAGSFFWIWKRAAERESIDLEGWDLAGPGFEKQSLRKKMGKQMRKRRASRVSFIVIGCVWSGDVGL